jgi:hypothetical protein
MKTKNKTVSTVTNLMAWAWFVKEDDGTYNLLPWSNGESWQFPVFPTRLAGSEWCAAHPWASSGKGKFVKVNVIS